MTINNFKGLDSYNRNKVVKSIGRCYAKKASGGELYKVHNFFVFVSDNNAEIITPQDIIKDQYEFQNLMDHLEILYSAHSLIN